MSNEEVAFSNQLVIRFDQDEHGRVTWHLQPDEQVGKAVNTSLEELAEIGAPLCAMGIHVLYDLFAEEFINHALEKANIFLWKEYLKRQLAELSPLPADENELRVVH